MEGGFPVIHSDGSFNFHQVIAFTGVVCGQPGVFEIWVVGSGDFNEDVLTGTYTITGPPDVGRGNGQIVSQPGSRKHVRGSGALRLTPGARGTCPYLQVRSL
jgi:hypothetical protein